MIQARCSRLPLLAACSAAQVAPSIRIEGDDSAARLGTATHKINAARIVGDDLDVFEVAADYNVPADELGMLAGISGKIWREQLSGQFPVPTPERSMEYGDADLTLTGTADLCSIVGDEIRIGDWKTGQRTEHDAREQLRGYAFLALQMMARKETERVRVYTIFVRDQRVDVDLFERAELLAWWEWLKAHLKESETYRPGPHCGNCPRMLDCNAHGEMMTDLSASLLSSNEIAVSDMADIAALGLQKVRLLKRRIEDFEHAVKAEVSARGGRWGNLVLKTTHPKSIDVARAMPHMVEALSEATILPLLKIGKGDLEDAIKKDAPRGQKGKAVAEFMERLENVGALVEKETQTLIVERNYDGTDSNTITAGEPATAAAIRRN